MDNIRIVCNISLWTHQVFELWPRQISYSHPYIGPSLFNLIFTHICDPCQKHNVDGPPDAQSAIFILQRCTPLTPDHIERTRKAFYSIKQGCNEVATSYLNQIWVLTRDCYHAGIANTDADLVKQAICSKGNHHYSAASYQRFNANLSQAELNNEELPFFSELESHLLNIEESRGLTLPSKNQYNYNQRANAARQHFHHHSSRPASQRNFTPRQQQAHSSILRRLTQHNNNQPNNRPPNRHQRNQFPTPNRPNNNQVDRQNAPPSRPHHGVRPPQRPMSANSNNQRRPPNNSTPLRRNTSTNATNIVCNNCGRNWSLCKTMSNSQPFSKQQPQRKSPSDNHKRQKRRSAKPMCLLCDQCTPIFQSSTLYHQVERNQSTTIVHQPSGLTQTYHKWKSINRSLIKTLHHQPHMHLPTQMQLNSFLMIQLLHINNLDHQTLTTGSPTVAQQVNTLLSSAIFAMSSLAMSLSP